MLRPRIIPVLLIKDEGLVKSIKFDNPSYVGDPLNAVRIFNEKMVDELIVLDIEASRSGAPPNFELIKSLAEECFMPLCYGGGVTTIDQMEKIFSLGVEKISLNSNLLDGTGLLKKAAGQFGRQSVVGSIDVKKTWRGYKVFSHSGRKVPEANPVTYAMQLQDAGAGELLLTSVDADGMREGFDLVLCKDIASAVDIPVLACGGGGDLSHFRDVILQAGVAGAAGGSYFVHQGRYRAVLISYPEPKEIEAIGQREEGNRQG